MSLIATSGIRKNLPLEFPLDLAENSGNIVHGNAPAKLFPNTMGSLEKNWRVATGHTSFRDFASEHCSHVIITMANLFRVGDHSEVMKERYRRFAASLRGYDKPVVIFGMGAQKLGSQEFDPSMLPKEGIEALEAIGEVVRSVSVRGDYTKHMLESVIGQTGKVFVTGCPSYYTHPAAFPQLKETIESGVMPEVFSVNVTDYRRAGDLHLLKEALAVDAFLVEPSNKNVHRFAVDSMRTDGSVLFPDELAPLTSRRIGIPKKAEVREWISRRYRLFRQLEPWIDFNGELVDGTVGTRFHVNMASMLAGVPAVWVTHDVRTEELTEALSLPRISLENVQGKTLEQLFDEVDFSSFLEAVPGNFERFNVFLAHAGLPLQVVPGL